MNNLLITYESSNPFVVINSQTLQQKQQFHQEVSLMYYLSQKYPYFAKIYAYEESSQIIILKYYKHGPLEKWLRRKPRSKHQIMNVILCFTRGVAAMHKENIAHCDLKPDNVLIDHDDKKQPIAVLIDLGISKILNQNNLAVKQFKAANIRGFSPSYAAPEAIQVFKEQDTRAPAIVRASDIYSLACIYYRILSKRPPWLPQNTTQVPDQGSSEKIF